ncbi:MAG: hypothetical protein ABI871_05705 [Chthoniobacterales bacterium]
MKKSSLSGFLALGLTVCAAQADIIPTLDSIVSTGTNFQWNYTSNVTVDQIVNAGDYFTIYDFGGFLAGSNQQPVDWEFSAQLIGITPPTVLPKDNPNIPNLTWVYTGETPIAGQDFLGTFSVSSTQNGIRFDNFAAHATRANNPGAGTPIDNIGTVAVPVPEMSALAPIIGFCGLGVAGFATSFWRRRRPS